MHYFRVVYCLAVLFCLVVCVSANAQVSVGDATTAVAAAKAAVTAVLVKAQSELNDAQSLLDKVQSAKTKADAAASKSQKAATGNTEAVGIAETIKSLSNDVAASYSDPQQKLDTAVKSLTSLLADAKSLEAEPEITITPNGDQGDDYTETKGKATTLEGKVTTLDGKINTAVQPIAGVDTTVNTMVQKAKDAELKYAHVSAIVAVAKIKTILGNSDTTIRQIEQNKNAVSGIVGEMQTLKTSHPTVSDANIEALHQRAANALKDATDAVQNANNAKADIQTQKGLADAALRKVQPETGEVSEAKQNVQKAEECVSSAQLIVTQLNDALQTATNSVTNANDAKQKLQTALLTATSATHTEQGSTHSQVKTLQRSVSAAVTEIQTMMGEAVRILQETENHKKVVHDIVQEMKALKTTAKIDSNEIIRLCKNAEGELTKATGAVEKVKTEKEAMRKEKVIADAALKDVNAATEINKAQPHVAAATSCLAKVKENLVQVRSALQTAENSVEQANDLKQKLKTILSTTTAAPRTNDGQGKVKANPPEGEGTEPDQKDTTTQPTITKTEQPTSKESLNQGDNNADKLRDTLSKGAQNVPTTALTGGKAPAPGAKNDSAMTVSVPLLVALIASAILQ